MKWGEPSRRRGQATLGAGRAFDSIIGQNVSRSVLPRLYRTGRARRPASHSIPARDVSNQPVDATASGECCIFERQKRVSLGRGVALETNTR